MRIRIHSLDLNLIYLIISSKKKWKNYKTISYISQLNLYGIFVWHPGNFLPPKSGSAFQPMRIHINVFLTSLTACFHQKVHFRDLFSYRFTVPFLLTDINMMYRPFLIVIMHYAKHYFRNSDVDPDPHGSELWEETIWIRR